MLYYIWENKWAWTKAVTEKKRKKKMNIRDISEVGLTQFDDLLAKQEHEKVNACICKEYRSNNLAGK